MVISGSKLPEKISIAQKNGVPSRVKSTKSILPDLPLSCTETEASLYFARLKPEGVGDI